MKKSKTSAGRTKRPPQMTKEELIATLLKKKQCNSKALSIVEGMLESEVNSQWLLDSLQFISQAHYQDAVEERAIMKICGYPLCQKQLANIPKQQFRISTQNNRVYDISERKNFCSNACYRSSSFLKDQIMTSPLWLRDIDKVPEYKLLEEDSCRGGVGDEIDVGLTRVTAEEAFNSHTPSKEAVGLSQGGNDNDSQLSENEESLQEVSAEKKYLENSALFSQSERDLPAEEEKKTAEAIVNFEDNRLACTPSKSFETTSIDLKSIPHTTNVQKESIKPPKNSFATEPCSAVNANKEPSSINILETRNKAAEIDGKQKAVPQPTDDGREPTDVTRGSTGSKIQTVLADSITEEGSSGSAGKRKEERNQKSAEDSKRRKETDDEKVKVRKEKRTSRHAKVAAPVALPFVTELVEERLTEWFTVDSLCFLYGEQRTREMLGQLDGNSEQNFKPLDSATWDPEKHDRFVKICKRLKLLDLEDRSYDEKVINEEKNVVKKPLPDFNKLKEEAEKMDLRVKAFYNGQLEVEPRKVTFAEDTTEETEDNELPVIPLVHQHEQRALRRRLVLDALNRVLPDLLRTLGVHSSQVNSTLRGLVGTFALTAGNVTLNPRHWTLMAIAIIKLLSVREALLHRALESEASQKYLTLIQMSYNLGPTFLDLLIDRLVSSAIVPPKPAQTS